MPAHLTLAAVGEAKLSNGVRLATVDWRANRLADALAKAGARGQQPVASTDDLLAIAARAVRHSAQLLGRVTHAANNYTVEEVDLEGNTRTRVLRDATQPERCRAPAREARPLRPRPVPRPQEVEELVPPLPLPQMQGPSAIPAPLAARSASAPMRRRGPAGIVPALLASLGERLRPNEGPTAASRMAVLRARIRAREAAALNAAV